MQINYDQTQPKLLTAIGKELVHLLKRREYEVIVERFSYALAGGRPLVQALTCDVEACLCNEQRSARIALAAEARIKVNYFKQPNSANLFGLVECFLPLDFDHGELLATLIVTTENQQYYVTLEDIS